MASRVLRAPPAVQRSRFALLDSSDSDSEVDVPVTPAKKVIVRAATPKRPAPLVVTAGPDPVMAALLRGDIAWGDIDVDGNLLPPLKPAFASAAILGDIWGSAAESDMWNQPFAANLEAHAQSAYDTSALTETEWTDMLSWLCANGWEITGAGRNFVSAAPADLPPTAWVSLEAFYAVKEAGAIAESAHPVVRAVAIPPPPMAAAGTDGGKRKGPPISQFCKAGRACEEAGCRYVHGDTIPVKNQPCGGPREGPHAGDACHCSKRHVEAGRTPCLFLHPDETWTEGMCRHRVK
jgi:hypothetical protein